MAPLQGYTEAEYRRAFADVYGAPDVCYTPFLRMEKGEAARRTLRDINSPLNAGTNTVPQIIFRDAAEFESRVMERVRREYAVRKNGEIIFRFPRFFFVANKTK